MIGAHVPEGADGARCAVVALVTDRGRALGSDAGPERAIHLHPAEHYPFWTTVRAQAGLDAPLAWGALGEDLTVRGLLENELWVGDVLRIGAELRLRVDRPRPAGTELQGQLGFGWALTMMEQSGFTGFFCDVIHPGKVAVGDGIVVVPGARLVTIREAHRLRPTTPRKRVF